MRYLTKELHDGDDQAAWEQALTTYANQLEVLRPRLSKRAYEFFARISLHDGTLISLTTGDAIGAGIAGLKSLSRNARKTAVMMKVLNYEQDALYVLRFAGIRRLLVDVAMENEQRPVIDDFLYGELTALDRTHLRYEISFASGGSVAIEFNGFSYKREQVPGGSGPVYA